MKVTVILTVAVILIFQLFEINIFTKEGAVKIPTIVSIITFFWIFYISYGWKWPLIKYIVYHENINGTWYGKYSSKDFTSNQTYEGKIAVVIRQSFLRIDVTSLTKDYINYSFGEAFSHNSKNKTNQLIYLYYQSQFKPTDDNIRKGTSELMLQINIDEKVLFGDFWTNHNSKGNLNLKKISSKHAKSFLEAKKLK